MRDYNLWMIKSYYKTQSSTPVIKNDNTLFEKEDVKLEDHSKHIKIDLNLTFALQGSVEIEAPSILTNDNDEFYPFYNIKCR